MIEYLLWSPSREAFLFTMGDLTNPLTGTPLATVEDGVLIPSECVRCDEIGPVTKTPAVIDEEGNEISPAVMVVGHHVNMVAYGALADMLTAGMPSDGNVFERTRILSFFGTMNWTPSQVGEPVGYVGTSGVKLFDPAIVNNRVRVWA